MIGGHCNCAEHSEWSEFLVTCIVKKVLHDLIEELFLAGWVQKEP